MIFYLALATLFHVRRLLKDNLFSFVKKAALKCDFVASIIVNKILIINYLKTYLQKLNESDIFCEIAFGTDKSFVFFCFKINAEIYEKTIYNNGFSGIGNCRFKYGLY